MDNKLTRQVGNEELLTRGVAPIWQRVLLAVFSLCFQIASACTGYALWSHGGWGASLGVMFFSVVFLLASYSSFRAIVQRREVMSVSMKPTYQTDDAIVCQKVDGWGATRSIVLDLRNRRVHFYRCFTHSRFLARPERWHSCQLDDVIRIRNPWEGFCVETNDGSAVIAYGTRLEELRGALNEAIATQVG